MYCGNCGKQIDDIARFCPGCGTAVVEFDVSDSDRVSATQEQASSTQDQTSLDQGKAPSKNAGKRPMVIMAALAIVVVVVLAGVFASGKHGSGDEILYAVPMTIQADEYSDESCTRIPVEATGTDPDGKQVSRLCYVDAQGQGMYLPEGNYTLSFPASPLRSDGNMYAMPSSTTVVVSQTASIPMEVATYGDGSDAPKKAKIAGTVPDADLRVVAMTAVPAVDCTDEMIDAAGEYASKDPKADKGTVSAYTQETISQRDAAIAQREEQAAQAEADRQASLAARTFTCEYFTCVFPEWVNGYTVEDSGSFKDVFGNGAQCRFYDFRDYGGNRLAYVFVYRGNGNRFSPEGEWVPVCMGACSQDPGIEIYIDSVELGNVESLTAN